MADLDDKALLHGHGIAYWYKAATMAEAQIAAVRAVTGLDPDKTPDGSPATLTWSQYARGINEALRCVNVALDGDGAK